MAKKAPLRERVAKRVARWADLPLAEDASGAIGPTKLALPEPSQPELPGTDEAHAKFVRWKEVDPFPEIPAALLNSADIDDYMRVAALVSPYDPAKRKTASYALSVGSEIVFWDPKDPDAAPLRTLPVGAAVVIPPNSLIYVRTAELFQLPNYMAVRFNLHIDLVHKGLLLGTGPLVDPGFFGRLMVPLHNLTSNTYVLAVGDEFIWAEFTKTSPAAAWDPTPAQCPPRSGALIPFPNRKTDKSLSDYVLRAQLGHRRLQPGLSHRTLQNAIPDAIERARKTAMDAKASATKAKRRAGALQKFVTGIGILTFIGAGGVMVSQIQASRSALQTTLGLVKDTNAALEQQKSRIGELEVEIAQLRAEQRPPPPLTTERDARPKPLAVTGQ